MLENLKLGGQYDGFLFLAEAARNPPVLRSHRHAELELNLVVEGTITYVVRGQRFTFGKRTLLWMFPAQEHQLVDRTSDAQYYVAVFKPGLIRTACRSERYNDLKRSNVKGEGVLQTTLEPGAFDLVKKTMELMMIGALDADVLNREAGFGVASNFLFEHGDPDALNAGLRHLLLLCWRYQLTGGTTSGAVALHPAVIKALGLLGDGDWPGSLGELARQCGVSEAYLSRVFAGQMGVSLGRYRNSVRMGRFLELCRQPGRKTMLEAAYAAGFGSYAQFYKVFVQTYGTGPSTTMKPRE
ncbi:MAG: AraC family transcriptional regulator [Luteolibacter sp.]